MAKKASKHTRKLRNLVMICAFSSIMFIVTTYAWFIGMRTVNVSTFDVSIATTDSLLLSLDGKKWDTTVSINSTNYNDTNVVYANHANTWSGEGLVPVSSVGTMDTDSSRMVLFDKGSLTATKGGYRLMAAQLNNYTNTVPGADWQYVEKDGYVAFDLFVKNFSGNAYYSANNTANEEAIYLTTDSEVTVSSDGGQAGTGIENSVRVAFAQIGRVNANTQDPDVITKITCNTAGDVTGICRTAQIWEPNEKAHVAGAITNYNSSCKKRTGADVFADGAYSTETACGTLADGTAMPTYAVNKAITETSAVDVYDGTELNGYAASTGSTNSLYKYDTFTDTEKNLAGAARPEFITLAPNSITKVRVYIYIEGQDVDNYDLASIGKKISVAFGFTKDRYDYMDNAQNLDEELKDTVKPVLSLIEHDDVKGDGDETPWSIEITKDSEWNALQYATATDNKEGVINAKIRVVNDTVQPDTVGTYLVSYLVSDRAGNTAQLDVPVKVVSGE